MTSRELVEEVLRGEGEAVSASVEHHAPRPSTSSIILSAACAKPDRIIDQLSAAWNLTTLRSKFDGGVAK
jgi:hypothetical protein